MSQTLIPQTPPAASLETQNTALRTVLGQMRDGDPDARERADFLLDHPSEADRALAAHEQQAQRVFDAARAYLDSDREPGDTAAFEREMDKLQKLHGAGSHRRCATHDARGPRRRK